MKTGISQKQAALLTLVAAALLPNQTLAQSASLPETVVTATRVVQPLTDVVADVSIIDRAEIERMGENSVTQILARLPGLQSIGFGDAGRVFIRGADSRMTALYVDGIRVDSQDGAQLLGGGAPWDLVPVSQIERIEVLRGPASAVYGSDAMGGVIQIFTRRGQAGLTPYVNLGFGSFNTQKIGAGVSGSKGSWDYSLGLSNETSDGFNTRPDLIHTPNREPSAQRAANVRLGYQISVGQRLEAVALSNQSDTRYVPYSGGADNKAQASLSTMGLKWLSKWSNDYSTTLSLTQGRVARKDDVPFDYYTTMQGVLFENNLRIAGGNLSAVLEQKRDAFDSQPSGFGDPAFRGDRTQNAVGLGYGARIGAHSLQVNVRNDDDSIFGARQTGALAYGYAFAPGWRATASTGTAFRAPTLEQIFGLYGSAQLKAETNQSNEIGASYTTASSLIKAVVYRNVISNMISSSATLTTCSAGSFCYYNVGQASIQGATISGKYRTQLYDVRASFDMLDPRDDITGKTLSLRARRVLNVGVDRRMAGWLVGADVQAVGERFDDAANTTQLSGYTLLNLGASTQVAREWRLVMRVNNALEQVYQQVGNYATPGRTFFVGLNWQPSH